MSRFNRILIKLSGEMMGESGSGFSAEAADYAARQIAGCVKMDVQTGVLVGGGNIMRARTAEKTDRLMADFMGMTATIINALGLKGALRKQGVKSRVFSAVNLETVTEPLVVEEVVKSLEQGEVAIFAGGTGAPFFTTDTAAVVRALEIEADMLLKATKVEGVYSDDPESNPEAILYRQVTYRQAIMENLKIMDSAALALIEENCMKVTVFNFSQDGNLERVVSGENLGTRIGG